MGEIRMAHCRAAQANHLATQGFEGHIPVGTWLAHAHQRGHDLKVARLHRSSVLLAQCNADAMRNVWLFFVQLTIQYYPLEALETSLRPLFAMRPQFLNAVVAIDVHNRLAPHLHIVS